MILRADICVGLNLTSGGRYQILQDQSGNQEPQAGVNPETLMSENEEAGVGAKRSVICAPGHLRLGKKRGFPRKSPIPSHYAHFIEHD